MTIELTPQPPEPDAEVIRRAASDAEPAAKGTRGAWWRAGIRENVAPYDAAPDAEAAPF